MRAIQDNVETGLLIGSWCCGCFELCSDQVTLIRRDVVIQKIRFIAFFASNVELGYEWVFIGRENGDKGDENACRYQSLCSALTCVKLKLIKY